MKETIMKISCFFTGHNYALVERCSEDSTMAVKRYASGIWAILIVWFFIGFNFVSRYFKGNLLVSIAGALFMLGIIISLERFIILGHKKSNWVFGVRIFIGCIMAFLGSLILDQIIFKYDIAKQKEFLLGSEVRTIYLSRTIELNNLIDSLSASKARDVKRLADDNLIFRKEPNIYVKRPVTVLGTRRIPIYDTISHRILYRESSILITNYEDSAVVNPIHEEITFLISQIQKKEEQVRQYQNDQLSLKSNIENEIRQNSGFIDEQKALWMAIQESVIGKAAWVLFFLFFTAIELLIVLNKLAERNYTTDYETLVLHQKEMHEKKIKLLTADKP